MLFFLLSNTISYNLDPLPKEFQIDLNESTMKGFLDRYHDIYSANVILLTTSGKLHKREDLSTTRNIQLVNRSSKKVFYEVTTTMASLSIDAMDYLTKSTNLSIIIFQKLTVKVGKHFSTPESVKEVPRFIKTYNIDMSQFEEVVYNSFNDFFSRKIKLDLRPMPSDRSLFLSAADSRCMVFENIKEASDIWVKGNQFSISNLLVDQDLANEFANSSMVIFRLAPDDYHRWHFPFSGRLKHVNSINGTYYTVNPKAVNSQINVFTENHRIVRIFDTNFGKVVEIAVGALLVGSISLLDEEIGSYVEHGNDAGYFQYGGSTVIYLILENQVVFDADLIKNSIDNKMETYLKARERIGSKK
jgi:phosphatidylserine decarboxylase